MRRPSLCAFFLCAAILCALAIPQAGQAQVLYGSIVGNVKDASDAVVAGATVVDHPRRDQAVPPGNDQRDGRLQLSDASAGHYELQVNKEGFSPFTQTGLSVTVNNVTPSGCDAEGRGGDGIGDGDRPGGRAAGRPGGSADRDGQPASAGSSHVAGAELPAASGDGAGLQPASKRELGSLQPVPGVGLQRQRDELQH